MKTMKLSAMTNTNSRTYGMTLVELMAVVAMLAILSVIAFPTYFQYQERARRVDAKAALQQIATYQERFYISNFSYTANLAQLGFANNKSKSGFYVLSVPVADTNGFQAVAVPVPGSPQANDDDCQQFTIDDLSALGAIPDPDGDCW